MKNKKIIELQALEGNEQIHLTSIQKEMKPYTNELVIFWWVVFWGVILILLFKLWKEWRRKK